MEYLIAEVAGRNRWTQINIPLDLASFFTTASIKGNVDLIPVRMSGKQLASDTRKFTLKKSVNWTFGLSSDLATDADHPGKKQPIAVFRRMPGDIFRYCIVMPQNGAYVALENHLSVNYIGPARNRKRVVANQSTISSIFPSSPL